MRRVDNIVSVLDNALQRQAATKTTATTTPSSQLQQDQPPAHSPAYGAATPTELASTAEGQRLLSHVTHSSQEQLRHGRGPKQGEILQQLPGEKRIMLGDRARAQGTIKLLERWKADMPTEGEMLPRDKYTMFDRKQRGYRKGVHKLPKWTRVSQRLNPPGF